MLKNRKSLVVETLVRVFVLVAVIFLIILPACNKIKAAILDPEKKYNEAFESFVEQINEMSGDQETFSVLLKEKSAIVGFSKNADRWECFNCYVGIANPRPTKIMNKPNNQECNGQACICICSEFELLKEQKVEGLKTNADIGQCKGKLICKSSNYDITNKAIIKFYPGFKFILGSSGGTEYWKNGFLFVNGISEVNGLQQYNEENLILRVEKKRISNTPEGQSYIIIGFCNSDMLKYNKDTLGLPEGACINNDWAPKK